MAERMAGPSASWSKRSAVLEARLSFDADSGKGRTVFWVFWTIKGTFDGNQQAVEGVACLPHFDAWCGSLCTSGGRGNGAPEVVHTARNALRNVQLGRVVSLAGGGQRGATEAKPTCLFRSAPTKPSRLLLPCPRVAAPAPPARLAVP